MFALYEQTRSKSARDVRTIGLAHLFVMCELTCMTITEYRNHLKLTLEEFAKALDLKSKGQMSEIERSNKCSVAIALALEKHSSGLVDAATLNGDVAASREGLAA